MPDFMSAPLQPGQREAVKQLTREMISSRVRLLQGQQPVFQQDADIAAYQEKLADFGAELRAFDAVNDPDITAALFAYSDLRRTLSEEFDNFNATSKGANND